MMDATQLHDFAGEGRVAQDNDAFFLPNTTEMAALTGIIQLAAMRAAP
jgi:hypothetical protein